MKQGNSKNLKKLGLENKEIIVQPKKDGNRTIAHVTLNSAKLYTRTGKEFIPIDHIQNELVECFHKIYDYVNKKYNVIEYWIDGELFTSSVSFNKLNGILKKEKKDSEDLKLIDKLEYHIYDVILPVGYSSRVKIINYFNNKHLKVIKSYTINATEQLLQEYLDKFLSEGEEGLMIRKLDIPYENKRTEQLLKFKVFEDDEFEIIGFKKSIEGETLGSIQFKMKDGNTFYAAFKGTDEEQLEIWNNKLKYLNTKMTVEFFGYSLPEEGGRPRFPKAKGIRIEN